MEELKNYLGEPVYDASRFTGIKEGVVVSQTTKISYDGLYVFLDYRENGGERSIFNAMYPLGHELSGLCLSREEAERVLEDVLNERRRRAKRDYEEELERIESYRKGLE